MTTRGGYIRPDGRPPAAKGVGKKARRHDLERPATPGLHDSDLQKGDVQAMERGQRIAPRQVQESGRTPTPRTSSPRQQASGGGQGVEVPDAIDFLAERNGQDFTLPQQHRQLDNARALTWLPILRQLAAGPGASGMFVATLIDQARRMNQLGSQPATVVDLQAADDGIEAMLDAGVRSE